MSIYVPSMIVTIRKNIIKIDSKAMVITLILVMLDRTTPLASSIMYQS